MNPDVVSIYRAPDSLEPLELADPELRQGRIATGRLVSSSGRSFAIDDGIPDLVWPRRLAAADSAARDLYEGRAHVYDQFLPLTFATFGEDEADVRRQMVDLLNLSPGQRVLE